MRKKKPSIKVKASALRRMSPNDLPATVGLVKEVREELLHEITAIRHDLSGQKSEIQGLKSEFSSLRSEVRAHRESTESHMAGMRVLMEEQRSENRIVMDHLKTLYDRQTKAEEEAIVFKREIFALLKTARA